VTISDATTPSLTTAAGKTNSGFLDVLGKTSGGIKILPADASTNRLILTNAAIATANRTLTFKDPGGSDNVVYEALASTLTNKTLTSVVIGTGLTATGASSNDFSASTGTFKTSSGANSLSGAVTVTAAVTPSITLQAGSTNTGFLLINGKTSGGVKVLPADAMGFNLILAPAAVATADRTVTIPDPGGADSLAMIALAQTFTNKTLTSPVIATGLTASGAAANTFAGSTGTFLTSTGAVTIGPGAVALSGTATISANKNLLCSAGTTSVDMSLGTGTFLTSTGANTLSGAVTVNDATTPSITLASGKTNSGFVLVNGKTSGGVKLLPTDASGFTLTVQNAAVATADRTLTLPDPGGADSVSYIALTQTLTNKTLTAPVLSGTVTGTYTLGGTPTFTSPTINTPTISGGTYTGVRASVVAAGGAGSIVTLGKTTTGLADNVATDLFTVTIPNVAAAAWIEITAGGMTGAGDAGGAGDAMDAAIYTIGISRQVGVTTRAVISTKSVVGNSGAGASTTSTLTLTVTGMSGAAGAQQTFTIQGKVARSAGVSTNHVITSNVLLGNILTGGITIA
jgi:hypothetical protein